MNASTQSGWRPFKTVLGGLVDVPERLEVSDITLDSRSVTPGAAFMACRGRTHHGLEYAQVAAAAGARAILWEPAPGVTPPALDSSIVVRAVPNLSAQLGFIADRFFDAPSASVTVAGITGTNGKTTCAWLLAQALSLCDRPAAYMGTIGVGTAERLQPLAHTTPDAITVHRLLSQLRRDGAAAVAMEVSSHALDQHRCAGVRFHTAAFTNLTRDHLDYHADMASYGEAKARLLRWPTLAARVINVDDAFGMELASERRSAGAQQVRQFLTSQRPSEWLMSGDYVCAREVRADAMAVRLDLQTSVGEAQLESSLLGDFNVDNLLTVLAVLLAWEIPLQQACEALARCSPPPGRMQVEGGGALPLVLIDYAHTPDALAKALRAAREHCRGQLWCVFGCGGERDAGKRREMGVAAVSGADQLIVTDDNPRREDPQQITNDILEGVASAQGLARARVLHDRAVAIDSAIAAADATDVVLVAGKGHEDYQLVGTQRRTFSDTIAVRASLARRSAA